VLIDIWVSLMKNVSNFNQIRELYKKAYVTNALVYIKQQIKNIKELNKIRHKD